MPGTTPFLWGASSSPHQTEGNNVNSDWWLRESQIPGLERSGDAIDSYHRFEEDMRQLADAGLNAYRFGVEWARVELRHTRTACGGTDAEAAGLRAPADASAPGSGMLGPPGSKDG